MLHSLRNRSASPFLRRLAALVILPAALLVVAGPALAEEVVERKVHIKVLADDDGTATELDLSDLQVGETRWFTSDSGKEIAVTREENGYRLDIDGEETFIMSPGDGMHRKIMVHKMAEGGETVDVHSNVWVDSDHKVINLSGDGAMGDMVFVSGLGELDESQKQAIIDGFRAAGIEKEIRFAPAGPTAFTFVTSGEGVADGEGAIEIDIEALDGAAGDGQHVILIEKKTVEENED